MVCNWNINHHYHYLLWLARQRQTTIWMGNANATFTKVKRPITRVLFDQSPKFKRQNIRRQKLPTLAKFQLHIFSQINFIGPNVILTNSPSSSCSSSSPQFTFSRSVPDGFWRLMAYWTARRRGKCVTKAFFEFLRITVVTVINVVFWEGNWSQLKSEPKLLGENKIQLTAICRQSKSNYTRQMVENGCEAFHWNAFSANCPKFKLALEMH